jgi:CO/xanthine dehydrogenase FAD-binding subunit
VRLALGSVAPTVLRASHAEEFAAAHDWSDPRARAEFARLAAAESSPIDDLRGSAAYRRHAVEVLARRELERAGAEEC